MVNIISFQIWDGETFETLKTVSNGKMDLFQMEI